MEADLDPCPRTGLCSQNGYSSHLDLGICSLFVCRVIISLWYNCSHREIQVQIGILTGIRLRVCDEAIISAASFLFVKVSVTMNTIKNVEGNDTETVTVCAKTPLEVKIG